MGSRTGMHETGRDPAGRKAQALSKLCVLRPLPDPVLAQVDEALTGYLAAAIAQVRAEVAARLADCDWAPVEAVRMLAFDEIEIARPILERSRRLAEADLEAIAALDRPHRCALARRESVSERLCTLIAGRRESECLIVLADNPGALLPDAAAADFASVARGAPELQRRLAARTDLRPGLARALMAVAGEAVKTALRERWPDLAPERVETVVDAAAEAANPADGESAQAVASLAGQGLLSAADLVRAAEGLRQSMTDHVAARLTGLEVADWRRALSRSPLRAALLCARSVALPPDEAARFHAALANSGRAHALQPDRLAAACEDVYAGYDRDAARRALHRLGAGGSIH
ncbi:MAG: DUF2336 domain-containing protein [Oceanicaulis sp.]